MHAARRSSRARARRADRAIGPYEPQVGPDEFDSKKGQRQKAYRDARSGPAARQAGKCQCSGARTVQSNLDLAATRRRSFQVLPRSAVRRSPAATARNGALPLTHQLEGGWGGIRQNRSPACATAQIPDPRCLVKGGVGPRAAWASRARVHTQVGHPPLGFEVFVRSTIDRPRAGVGAFQSLLPPHGWELY